MQAEIEQPVFAEQKNFWKQQFSKTTTKRQKVFDILFGIILPIVCFYYDPFIFKDGFVSNMFCSDIPPNPNNLSPHQFAIFVFTLAGLGMVILTIWLIAGPNLHPLITALFAGIFFAGAEVALAVGIVILPMSFLGLLFWGLGALGFIPLVASFVYLRNGIRAWQNCYGQAVPRFWIFAVALTGVIAILTVASVAQWRNTLLEIQRPKQVVVCDD